MANHEHEFDVKAALGLSLNAICDEDGSAFYAQRTTDNINPGLHVQGVGDIGLPISEHDAQRIISLSKQAPFGKGSETFVDTSVRRTWEIDAKHIELRHPKWPSLKRNMIDDVASQLGITRGSENVQAELYKLLIYEPGAMFKPHKEWG